MSSTQVLQVHFLILTRHTREIRVNSGGKDNSFRRTPTQRSREGLMYLFIQQMDLLSTYSAPLYTQKWTKPHVSLCFHEAASQSGSQMRKLSMILSGSDKAKKKIN